MKDRVIRATKAVIRFMGPVATAVHGELSKPEVARVLVKAWISGTATWGATRVTITDPSMITDVVVPVTAAVFTGAMDALARLEQGDPKPKPPLEAKPVPADEPPPPPPVQS